MMLYIGVIGSGECDSRTADLAFRVGEGIARAGAILVCGGRGGVMEAAARGARDQGGTVIGILPGFDRSEANPHLSYSIITGLAEARNAIIVRSCHAVIAVAGGPGTLSEIGLALRMGVPVVGLETWEIQRAGEEAPVIRARSPEDAVALALEAAGRYFRQR